MQLGVGQKSLEGFPTRHFFSLGGVYFHSHYMPAMQPNPEHTADERREQILDRIASITKMRPGTLTEEFRQGAIGKDGKPSRLGPYYKLQVWRDGANRTCRVPADQADDLREDIENYHTFNQLCRQLAEINIQHTLALRADQSSSADPGEGKKNSTRKQPEKDSPKPKPSSRKPKRS